MAGKRFSKEEIEALKRSPYVAKASPIQVSFTTDFKQMAYQELTEGKTMRTILEESGINPEILGERRIWSMTFRMRQEAEREEGFEDQRRKNKRKPRKQKEEQTLAERIEQLEHELAYTKQEVEFLKKYGRQNWRHRKHGNPKNAENKIQDHTRSNTAG